MLISNEPVHLLIACHESVRERGVGVYKERLGEQDGKGKSEEAVSACMVFLCYLPVGCVLCLKDIYLSFHCASPTNTWESSEE